IIQQRRGTSVGGRRSKLDWLLPLPSSAASASSPEPELMDRRQLSSTITPTKRRRRMLNSTISPEHGGPLAAADGSTLERGVQWVLIGDPGAKKHLYAETLQGSATSSHFYGNLLRQELSPRNRS
ncbi:Probable adenylate kinase 7, mitochondrial, partial [Linum perenne]